MTSEALRVLQALEWSERTALSATLPMRRIATATLGGNDDLAAKVLTDRPGELCSLEHHGLEQWLADAEGSRRPGECGLR